MPLDYTLQIDNDKVRIACNKMNAQATSVPFPLPMLTEILPAAMDRRVNAPRSIKVEDETYDVRFNNMAVRIAKNSQVITEFPMHWAMTIIAMARGVEGDPFATA